MPKTELDSIVRAKSISDRDRAFDVLWEAQNYWLAMETFRQDRERNKNYTYGKQWDDYICVDGKRIKEGDYIMSQGNVPLKNNLIRRIVQAVLGVYRSQAKEPTCTARDRDEQKYGETMSTVLQCNMQLNSITEINARCMEEFLISGFVVQRKWYGWRDDKLDCWTDYVQPNNFFIDNNMRDFRGWDVSCVGELHDISFESLCERFAHNADDYSRLAKIYRLASDKNVVASTYDSFGYPLQGYYDFLVPYDATRCRVIEIWRRESKLRYRCHDVNSGDVFKIEIDDFEEFVGSVNRERLQTAREIGMDESDVPLIKYEWFMDSYWYYYYLTPFGDILDEGETPYEHKSHPYVFKAYPFIDGEIHSFVSNVIDQQRYTNRLITMYDWIMRMTGLCVQVLKVYFCSPKNVCRKVCLRKIRDVEFDLSIVESTSTPAYRAMANDMLMQLLQSIKSQREQIEKGQVPDGISPELAEQVQQGANMQAARQAQQMLQR